MKSLLKFHKKIEQSDEELLAEYKKSLKMCYLGDLYARYITLVYGVSLKYLKNEEEAKDAVMQVFEELTEKLLQHEVRNFKSWLYVVAKNYCLMRLRAGQRARTIVFDEKFMEFEAGFHLQEVVDDRRSEEALEYCIEQLPPRQQRAVRYFYFEELPYKEIAVCMKDDIQKVKSYLQNGKRNLKLCLEKNEQV